MKTKTFEQFKTFLEEAEAKFQVGDWIQDAHYRTVHRVTRVEGTTLYTFEYRDNGRIKGESNVHVTKATKIDKPGYIKESQSINEVKDKAKGDFEKVKKNYNRAKDGFIKVTSDLHGTWPYQLEIYAHSDSDSDEEHTFYYNVSDELFGFTIHNSSDSVSRIANTIKRENSTKFDDGAVKKIAKIIHTFYKFNQ